ncbi:hypothetical protein L6452_38617 [Arctium lappa]|uniref:Uncharacterized protein n=1 Tax=Arctium lappa TaxID=4217 RepID=A0ACB8XU54_ARCLA|nr:hypothetical protein L6452_38617 [Arctium lappa]
MPKASSPSTSPTLTTSPSTTPPPICPFFYVGSLLGSAQVSARSQPPRSCQVLHLPARLSSKELALHVVQVVADVRKREMVLDATMYIEGVARLGWWGHRFKVHVDSHMIVDPVFLDVIDQENKSDMDLFVAYPSIARDPSNRSVSVSLLCYALNFQRLSLSLSPTFSL